MVKSFSRRAFLSAVSASFGTAIWADAPTRSLRPALRGAVSPTSVTPPADAIVAAAKLGGDVHFAVADAATGNLLESRGGAEMSPPASVTKTVTALYALEVLGDAHRFTTSVMVTGTLRDGVVSGDLVLVGGGDPTLDTDDLQALAASVKAAGIREVRGRFVVYHGALDPIDRIDASQPDQVGYNPGLSGIALNFNRVHFEWRRGADGYAVTMDARTKRYRPEVTMARMRIVDRKSPIYTYTSLDARDDWTVARQALGKGGARWLPVRKPGLYAGDVFRTLLRAQGIVLKAPELSARARPGIIIARHKSAALREIVRGMLKYSNNLTAEMIGLAATRRRTGKALALEASAAQMSQWAAQTLGMRRLSLVDHSGLGDASRMTAQDMARALVHVRTQVFRELLKPIWLRDAKGRPVKDHPVKTDAKTGTLNFVSSLAGYITAADGREMAFAIFASDTAVRSKIRKEDRERPPGARSWNARAKRMQRALIERWATRYGTRRAVTVPSSN